MEGGGNPNISDKDRIVSLEIQISSIEDFLASKFGFSLVEFRLELDKYLNPAGKAELLRISNLIEAGGYPK